MSNADTRQEFATALSTVAGIHGHASKPSTLNEGDAWPQWRGSTPHAGAAENRWAVLIVLPQSDDINADAFIDSHGQALMDALRPVMFIDSIDPATIGPDNSPMYALLITGRCE